MKLPIRRRCFISYHHADQEPVNGFINTFDATHDVFIARALGTDMDPTVVNSNNPEYVMQRINRLAFSGSTVTIVIVGRCTWARRYVDWEVQASLRSGPSTTPNGLLAIQLPSHVGSGRPLPDRVRRNIAVRERPKPMFMGDTGPIPPPFLEQLSGWIEDAYQARTGRPELIKNPRERKTNDSPCP